MATSKKNDLIGYDPLAWMESNADENKVHPEANQEAEEDLNIKQIAIEEEILTSVDSSEDSVDIIEDGTILDIANTETLEIDEIEGENDSALVEEMAKDSASEDITSSIFDLDATLSIQNVVQLHEKLKKFLVVHDEFEINASDVASVDTATLQLLVSLKKEATKLQKKMTIIYPSPRFVESVQLLGLMDVLGVHDV